MDRGQIKLKEQEITNLHPKRIIQQGLGYIPEDRLHVGTIGSFSIWENLILKDHHQTPYAKRFFYRIRLFAAAAVN
ncbi:hypothetical protein N752_25540 [Desulforamulus aquiferis]|nr:hypothetical protein [Desulforamulus aquiferis]RYD02319.1 hypothetical protein N752_25540 [Desulforamulus aquiferis]